MLLEGETVELEEAMFAVSVDEVLTWVGGGMGGLVYLIGRPLGILGEEIPGVLFSENC